MRVLDPDRSSSSSNNQSRLQGRTEEGGNPARVRPAPRFHRYIDPDETAQHLSAGEKILFGLHQPVTPFFLLTISAAGAYEHAANSSPNYGTDSGAYGQRVGAAAVRDFSQEIFSYSIMSPLLHDDPRYYIVGRGHNVALRDVALRASYAVMRVLIGRSDRGRTTPNLSLIGGYAGAAALTMPTIPTLTEVPQRQPSHSADR